jgi:A/G-specific adenine glycosylase
VLCSEVMLQQTQAARVAEIYPRFMRRFPTPRAMARAEAADVLRAWENLGYNLRALNLWRTARALVALPAFPSTVDGLAALPGIGPYTARAVASFCFDAEVAAVDANVRRVVTRLYGPGTDVQREADRLVPRGDAAAWNQAMIDLGAVVCTARNPRCDDCPLRRGCVWRAAPQTLPPRRPSERFESTQRYARGRVVGALRDGGALTVDAISARTGLGEDRLEGAVASLVRDGLVHRRRGFIALGPATFSRR